MTFGFVTCGPNEALVVSGCFHSRPLLIPGGRTFVLPGVHKVQRLCLNTMTLSVESPCVYTSQGVPISVTGIAQVKIQGQNQEMLMNACEQFLGKTLEQIRLIALETLEGHQRAIMGTMTVEEIYRDRKKFSKQVFEVASSDLLNLGITVVSYTLKDIRDDMGYLKALGQARTAEVQRDARIGQAQAKATATIRAAEAEEERMAAKLINDTQIAKAQRDYQLQKAAYDEEVATKKAIADFAFELQAAKIKQQVKEEEVKVKIVERGQQTSIQDQEVARKQKELEATVLKEADAEKYRLEKTAEAEEKKLLLEAHAVSEGIRLRAEAEATAIEAKAKAEAEVMAAKAAAFAEFKDAAIVSMLLETLPKVAAEVGRPLSNTSKITMVSAGDGPIGVNRVTSEVMDIIAKIPELIKSVSGVDIGPLNTAAAAQGGYVGGYKKDLRS